MKHGMNRTPTHHAWCGMISRCENPNESGYHNYGGRGIRVCESWRTDFSAFFSDMGAKPPGKSLDRIDNNGNYEPSNCRWATRKEQNRNRRNNVFITHNGETQCMEEWAQRLRVSPRAIAKRLERGVPVDQVLVAPFARRTA
jgi:hypothetical protein